MKQKTNKIKAFTLSEMIVVLILTSIVVGLAFSVLTLVQSHMRSINKNYHNTSTLNKLEASLWLDFNKYSQIHFNDLENELKFSSEIDSVTYQFLDSTIIKNIDTFQITLKQKQFFFDGDKKKNGQIDALKLETKKEFQNQQLFIFKHNDANTYMK